MVGVMAMMIVIFGLLFVASILSMTEETKGRYVGILHVANEKLEKNDCDSANGEKTGERA